jgi:hypothetical protein
LPSFALISFKRLFCGLFLIHSIRFDLIVLTVAVRDGSQRPGVRHDDPIAELLPLLTGPDRNTFPPPLRRVPEASVKPGQPISRHLAQGFVANSEVAQGTVFVRSRSFVTVSVPARNADPIATATNEVRSHALRAQQGNQAFLRGSASGARKRHPNLPRFACADLRFRSALSTPFRG